MTRRVRLEIPSDVDSLVVAQAVVGPHVLLKAVHAHARHVLPFRRWDGLNEVYGAALKTYKAVMAAMQAAIVAHIEKHIVGGKLSKAGGRPLMTPAQLQEITKIIQEHHEAFIKATIDPAGTPSALIEELVRTGVLPATALDILSDAYMYGQVVATMKAQKPTQAAVTKQRAENPIQLSAVEKEAIDWARHSAAVHVRGLGNQVADDFSTVAIEADRQLRKEYEKVIRDEVVEGIDERKAWREVASSIGHATEDWSRDLGRIAATEMQRAMQEGFAQGLTKREGGDPDAIMVAKFPMPDACKHCVAHHLTAGQGSAPRVFKLSTLEANGSNVGRKAAEWKPVVGPLHPWCACELVHVPPGWSFEDEPAPGEGWEARRGGGYQRTKKNPSRAYNAPAEIVEYWQPELVPDAMRRSEWAFTRDLHKGRDVMRYNFDDVPEVGVVVRVGDPKIKEAIDKVIEVTPEAVFRRDTGITLITTDTDRVGSALDGHDLAYWTGNEIRLSQTLPLDRVDAVLKHEIGHALNIYLMRTLGTEAAVRAWHTKLDKVSKTEGYVSDYAKELPIENAAEVTRLYLYERNKLMKKYPMQFALVHKAYRAAFYKATS